MNKYVKTGKIIDWDDNKSEEYASIDTFPNKWERVNIANAHKCGQQYANNTAEKRAICAFCICCANYNICPVIGRSDKCHTLAEFIRKFYDFSYIRD